MYRKRYLFVSTQDTTQEKVAEKMQPAPSCNRELKKTIQRKKEVKKRKKKLRKKKTGEKIYRSKNCTIVSIRSEKNKIALLTWRCYDRRNHVSLFLHLFPSSPCLQLPCSWNSILSKNFINRLDHDFVHLYDHLQALGIIYDSHRCNSMRYRITGTQRI